MKSPLKQLLLLFLLISSKAIQSCNAADQCRLFPLGSCSSGFVFVETHLYRTTDPKGNRYEMPSKWFGESFLKVYDDNHRLVSSRLLDSLTLRDKINDERFIKNSFMKGLGLAKQLHGFTAAKPVYLSYCDFQQKCQDAQLRNDTVKHVLFVKLRNQKQYEVKVLKDTTSIAGRYLEYYGGFNGGLIDYSSIDISSVRKYTIGTKTVTVLHLANGDKPEAASEAGDSEIPKRKEYKPNVAFNLLETSIVYEPLLHHGHGFDFFIVE
jgi:hypothetical protein